MNVGKKTNGFTVVELLVVIVVIGILASIAVLSYNGLIVNARETSVITDTSQNSKAMEAYGLKRGDYALDCEDAGVIEPSSGTLACNTSGDGEHFCLSVTRDDFTYFATDEDGTPRAGICSGFIGLEADSVFTDISAGQGSTCGIAAGKAYCWGANWSGQLGNGTTTDVPSPGAVVAASGILAGKTVTKVAANGDQSCVIADARAYCFGDTYGGALGNGVTVRTNQTTPVAVDTSGVLAGKAVTDITVGGYYAYNGCVVADGAGYCWGFNGWGQLGTGTTVNSAVPVAVLTSGVLSGKTMTSIDMYEYHACATASGAAYCWGGNGNGYLGNGQVSGSTRDAPVAVVTSGVLAGKTVTAVSPGDYHTCAVADGKAYCFGSTYYGTLGNGVFHVNNSQSTPIAVDDSGVLAGKTITAMDSGYAHTCVIASGQPHCWGESWGGALGQGSDTPSAIPVLTAPLP